ncbi:MAG: S-layer homology domain-containing protein [Bacillota bacterium]
MIHYNWTDEINPDVVIPSLIDFDSIIYKASYINRPDSTPSQMIRDDLYTKQTPSENLIEQLQANGFETSKTAWEILTNFFDTIEDPTTAIDTLKKDDLYMALILYTLEEEQEDIIDLSICKELHNMFEKTSDYLVKYYQATEEFDILNKDFFQTLTDDDKKAMLKTADEYVKTEFVHAEHLSDVISAVLFGVESFVEFSDIATGIYTLHNTTDAIKNVFEEMKSIDADNYELSKAIDECVEAMQATESELEQKILGQEIVFVGETLAVEIFSELWKGTVGTAMKKNSVLGTWIVVYKTGKFLMNSLYNTDATIESYNNMLMITEIESLVIQATRNLSRDFMSNISDLNKAENFLGAIDLSYAFRYTDCVQAYNFYGALDNTVYGWFSDTPEQYQKLMNTLKSNYNLNHIMAHTAWVSELDVDYPDTGLYEYYNEHVIEAYWKSREITIACPVDVMVYDSNDNLVLEITNNRVENYSNNVNMIIRIIDDVKTIEFYDEENYRIEYIGNDTGTMDVTIVEYGSNEVVSRTVEFYDIALMSGKEFTSAISNQTNTTYEIIPKDGGEIAHDYDSNEQTTEYAITTTGGIITTRGVSDFELNASADEKIEIQATIPYGYEFVNWTSESSQIVFKDDTLSETSLRMPAEDIHIVANFNRMKPTISDFDITFENNSIIVSANVDEGTSRIANVVLNAEINDTEMRYPMQLDDGTWKYTYIPSDVATIDFTITAIDGNGYTESSLSQTISFDGSGFFAVYTILFDARGGVLPMSLEKTNTKGRVDTWPVVEKADYSLVGWYDSIEGGNQITLNTTFEEDMVVYAQWKVVDNSGGGNGNSGNTGGTSGGGGSSSSSGSNSSSSSSSTTTDTDSTFVPTITPSTDSDSSTSTTATFSDTASHWAKASIDFMVERGLMSGTGNGQFSPNTAITRGMFIAVLSRYSAEDLSAYTASSFGDVPQNSYYMKDIEWAKANGIVSGMSATTFAPDMPITREQMAVILANYMKYRNITLPETTEAIAFSDSNEFSSWAADSVVAMQQYGILSGKGNNLFDPKGTGTRAEFSSMMERFILASEQ